MVVFFVCVCLLLLLFVFVFCVCVCVCVFGCLCVFVVFVCFCVSVFLCLFVSLFLLFVLLLVQQGTKSQVDFSKQVNIAADLDILREDVFCFFFLGGMSFCYQKMGPCFLCFKVVWFGKRKPKGPKAPSRVTNQRHEFGSGGFFSPPHPSSSCSNTL